MKSFVFLLVLACSICIQASASDKVFSGKFDPDLTVNKEDHSRQSR